jgi:hypothetical protein
MGRFAVWFKSYNGLWPYTPEGGEVNCDEQTARERHATLIEFARGGFLVHGLPVKFVAVVDATVGPKKQVALLAQYPDDEPAGPWAEKAAA